MKNEFLLKLVNLCVPLLNVLVCVIAFVANPVIGLLYPPIGEFIPGPEPQPAGVEKHSIADYSILYGAGADAAEIKAANILADTLKQISGVHFTAAPGVPSGGKEILVGAISGEDVTGLGNDGFLVKEEGSQIIIAGGHPRGVLYGVYDFLYAYFGCRWYTHAFIVIPEGPAEIARVEKKRYAPPLEYRESDWLSTSDPIYSVANGLNGDNYRDLPAELGSTVGYKGPFCHSMVRDFVKPDDFYGSHPDWYAYREDTGKREPTQLCLTNSEVLAEMILAVRWQLANGNGQPIVTVTQDDNEQYCQCAACKQVDEEEGSHAGTMIRFVNAVAADIAQDYPDALIDTFAYRYTRTPPKYAKPLPNVIVRLCSIECCFAHPLDDPACATNTAFANDIKGWSQICDRLYVWDYTTDYLFYNCVYPNFQVLQKNMQFFVNHNAVGVYASGNYYAPQSDSEFAGLRGYLLARLLFNPDIDYDAEMNEFLKAYYGGGWQYIREFIDLAGRCAGTNKPHAKMGLYSKPTDKDLLKMKPNQLAYADRLWEKAIELAGDGYAGAETCQRRMLRSQLSWRFWKACNRRGEFCWWLLPNARWQGANEALYNDFKAFGITRYAQGNENYIDLSWRFLPEPPGNWWGTPEGWHG